MTGTPRDAHFRAMAATASMGGGVPAVFSRAAWTFFFVARNSATHSSVASVPWWLLYKSRAMSGSGQPA